MEKNSNNIFVTMTVTVLSLMFIVLSIIPIIGPGIGAYALGTTIHRHKNKDLSNVHIIIAITIGELIYCLISSLLLAAILKFYESGIFWYFIIISFIINYISSIILYFWGNYKAKKVATV